MLACALIIWGGVASWLRKDKIKPPWFPRSMSQPSFRAILWLPGEQGSSY